MLLRFDSIFQLSLKYKGRAIAGNADAGGAGKNKRRLEVLHVNHDVQHDVR
jgi:hypothetical protein